MREPGSSLAPSLAQPASCRCDSSRSKLCNRTWRGTPAPCRRLGADLVGDHGDLPVLFHHSDIIKPVACDDAILQSLESFRLAFHAGIRNFLIIVRKHPSSDSQLRLSWLSRGERRLSVSNVLDEYTCFIFLSREI